MHAQEASTCINFKNDKWVVSHYERAIDRPIGTFDNLIDAACAFLENVLPGERWRENREWFEQEVKKI